MDVKSLAARFEGRRPLLLIVLDGWGVGAHDEGDAIFHARKPTLDALMAGCAHSELYTHGLYVGLPAQNDIGGSEVGHMTMGAGRIMAQGPTRIGKLIESGAFYKSAALRKLTENCRQRHTPLHLVGLLSDGNVHSHLSHFERIVEHAVSLGIQRLYVHALLDGRDVPYQSALDYVEPLEAKLAAISRDHAGWDYAIASGGGREVITMDRDQNWEKVRRGWEVHVHGREGMPVPNAAAAVRAGREAHPEAVDQDLPPFVVVRNGKPVGPIEDGASVVFMNFRGDRAIEFSRAMVEDDFTGFDRGARPRVLYAGMMKYDEDTNLPPDTLVETAGVEHPFGKRILELGLHQFRLAETQKYAHVTFFFNGGYREPLDPSRESYELIQSDRVDSFALAPAMKAREIGVKAQALIRSGRYAFGLINFANTDMVGHTGDLVAAIKAAEAVDQALAGIVQALREVGGLAIITADHGNAEEMIATNPKTGRREPSTRHSLNPVPVILVDPHYRGAGDYRLRPLAGGNSGGHRADPNTLANLMATQYILMGLRPPGDVDAPLFELS